MNLKQEWLALRVALQFLTRLPVPVNEEITSKVWGRSLTWYPFSGLVIGALLWLVATLLPAGLSSILSAALLLAAWVWLTGALHLDGVADCVDAIVGGGGDRERTLSIMKDPRCGPMAVVALVVLLLVKFAALESLLAAHSQWILLLLIPMLARALILPAFLTTPYVRAEGLGSALAEQLPKQAAWTALAASLLLSWLLLPWLLWWCWVVMLGLLFVIWRRSWCKRLGGFTGDAVGTLVELAELLLLVVTAVVVLL